VGINEDLTFHHLRGSVVVRLALAGSTVPSRFCGGRTTARTWDPLIKRHPRIENNQ
jgi:hypothetical protein